MLWHEKRDINEDNFPHNVHWQVVNAIGVPVDMHILSKHSEPFFKLRILVTDLFFVLVNH